MSGVNIQNPQAQAGEQNFNIGFLNAFFKNKNSVYTFLTDQLGYYLPSITSKAITDTFLLKALRHEIFLLKRDNVNPAKSLKEKVSNNELIEEIKSIVGGSKPLGFDQFLPPDKEYLTNILYTLKRDHRFFTTNSESETYRAIHEEYFTFLYLNKAKYEILVLWEK